MTEPMAASSSSAGIRTDTLTLVLGVLISVSLLGVRMVGEDTSNVSHFLAVMACAFTFYFAALASMRRPGIHLPATVVILVAAAIQFAPYRGAPLWDNDAYRHHWDGKLLANGVNPFAYAPGDHRLAQFRDEYWEPIGYKWIKTIYPPVTQYLLAGTWFLEPTPRRILLLAMVFNLLTLWPLMLLMRARGVPVKWAIIYAWNPLVANEFAVGGHLDAISVFFLLWSLYALERRLPGSCGAALAFSVMAKTQMVLVAPLLIWRARGRGLVPFAVICAALVAPFLTVGAGDLLSGSLAYAGHWENNSGAFAVLRVVLGADAARAATGALLVATVAWMTFRRGDVLLHCFVVLAVTLVLSPTFFPWYISWVLPFACFYPTYTCALATFLLLAPYLLYYDRQLAFIVRVPEMALMYATGAAELAWWRIRRRRESRQRP